MICPDVGPTNYGFPFKFLGSAAMYSKRDGVFNPRNYVDLILHLAGRYRAGHRCLCAGFKRLHFLVTIRDTKPTDLKPAILRQSAKWLYVVNRIHTGVLYRKLLCKRAGGVY